MRNFSATPACLIEPKRLHSGGFTLIEVIVSLALLGILAAVFGMGLTAAVESFYFSRNNVLAAQKGQLAMQRLARELTELTAVQQADADTIVYQRIENNPDPVVKNLKIHYDTAQRAVLLYSDSDAGYVLCDQVAGLELQYFSGSDPWGTTDGLQRLSAIELTLELDRPEDAAHPQRFNTLVHPRNTRNVGGAAS